MTAVIIAIFEFAFVCERANMRQHMLYIFHTVVYWHVHFIIQWRCCKYFQLILACYGLYMHYDRALHYLQIATLNEILIIFPRI